MHKQQGPRPVTPVPDEDRALFRRRRVQEPLHTTNPAADYMNTTPSGTRAGRKQHQASTIRTCKREGTRST
ncbi:unnamed protein product [Brassica oleracea]